MVKQYIKTKRVDINVKRWYDKNVVKNKINKSLIERVIYYKVVAS